MLKAVLFKSPYRFNRFIKKMKEYDVDLEILDFKGQGWLNYDYSKIDFVIYYPIFEFSSNHPLALQEVYDNIEFLHDNYPHLKIYPTPCIIKYYNDKYRQYLFLTKHGYPIPETIPLFSEKSVNLADKKLGYPMVRKADNPGLQCQVMYSPRLDEVLIGGIYYRRKANGVLSRK